jgi:hypothetical protein
MKPIILAALGLGLVLPATAPAKTSVSVGGTIGYAGNGYSIGVSGGYRSGSKWCAPRRYYSCGSWYPWGITLGYTFATAPVYYYAPPVVYEYPAPTVVYSPPPSSAVVYSAPAPASPTPKAATATPPAPKPRPMSVADVKALAKANLSDEVIINQIRSSRAVFQLTTAEIIDLRESGVSEAVINFMINTANR